MASTGNTHLPFSAEEHVRCNCTMFEGLKRWLQHVIQSSFQDTVNKHLQKRGKQPGSPVGHLSAAQVSATVQSGLATSNHYSLVCTAAGSLPNQSLTWASVDKELRSVALDWFTDAHVSADSEIENVKPDVQNSQGTSPCAASAIILVSDMLEHLEGADAAAVPLQGKQ